jgi:hypothetical protein
MKSSEPKNFKYQPRPLVRPSFVNLRQNLCNLSHETVPLNNVILGPKVVHMTIFRDKINLEKSILLNICMSVDFGYPVHQTR